MAHTLNNNHQATAVNWLIEWYATSVFSSSCEFRQHLCQVSY